MLKRRIIAAALMICLIMLCVPMSGALAESKYYITVDLTNQIVTVYDSEKKTDDINIVRQMICSTGRNATPTPTGTVRLPSKSSASERSEWYYFPKFKCYAKWATRIRGGILFHSTLFTAAKKGPTSSSTRALGSKASHGCVRLRVEDAKFIAKNCPSGTKCRIYASGKTNSSLRSKLKKKTFIRDDQTYDSFLGRQPAECTLPLSKGSAGTLVTELQTRLQALGFYPGKVNGTMGSSTVAAVKDFQAACGIQATGSVDQALWDVIFSDGAVTGTLVALGEGSTGPAVTTLQNNLISLLMLGGSADGTYSSQTTEAVTNYQTTFGFAVTGSADADLQEDIASRAALVRQTFGDAPYGLSTVTVEAQMAKVKASSGVKLRKTASKKAKSLTKLKSGTSMRVLSKGKSWTKVKVDTLIGYIQNSKLNFYTEVVTENGYVAVEVPPVTETTPDAASEGYLLAEAGDYGEALTADEAGFTADPVEETPESPDGIVYGTEPVDAPVAETEATLDDGLDVVFEALPEDGEGVIE